MSSPGPPPLPQRSPKRSTPTRTPLQERTPSEANERTSRFIRVLGDSSKHGPSQSTFTPYPNDPAQVLRPSTIRKQRWEHGSENIFNSRRTSTDPSNTSKTSRPRQGQATGTAQAPALTLKRSVAALRDIYEAQAEKSRPSTAASPSLRPTSASSRLRSLSSSEGLSGQYAWEASRRTSNDDLALLPSLADAMSTVKKIPSDLSFQSPAPRATPRSSPNFISLGEGSSSKIQVYTDPPNPIGQSTGLSFYSQVVDRSSSSPNVVRLGRSSSVDGSTVPSTNQTSSSPNFVKIGSSSPSNATSTLTSSSLGPEPSSPTPKKVKTASTLSFAARAGAVNFASSPPYDPSVASSSNAGMISPDASLALPTSPTQDDSATRVRPTLTNSPNLRSESSLDGSLAETHAHLQAVLSSSPAPPIQYPVVRAPMMGSLPGLRVPKRTGRSSGEPEPRWQNRLSTVPSEWSSGQSRSKRSSLSTDDDDKSEVSSTFAAVQAWNAAENEAKSSQVRMIRVSDYGNEHPEASDEVSALPKSDYQNQPQYWPSTQPTTSSSFISIFSSSNNGSRLSSLRNSMDHRLNNMRSFTDSRQNSMQSSSQRPGSSSSAVSKVQIPTWARRYYSGVYRDSFHQLYSQLNVASTSNVTTFQPAWPRPSTAASCSSRRSSSSVREKILNMFRGRTRPRLEARQSHISPGVGPLVSNPVRPRYPPPAATHSSAGAQIRQIFSPSEHQQQLEAQRVNEGRPQLHPADPRAHWAGIAPTLSHLSHLHDYDSTPPSRQSSLVPRRPRASEWSPHLHRNGRSGWPRGRWYPPSMDEDSERWFSLRNMQVLCFLGGFICPLLWFFGAVWRLPPELWEEYSDNDLQEKGDLGQTPKTEDMVLDLRARLDAQTAKQQRMKRENTMWWRGLNRAMSIVGVGIILVVVVLAAIYH